MIQLSILIPARNEEFLSRTIDDLLQNIEGDTEIIAVLDGYLPEPPLKQVDPRVTLIYHPESVGQRAGSNDAAKIARGKYVMKIDAHCAFDKGFDVKMLEAIKGHDDWTMAPLMRNLHAFDWVCEDGHRRYQGPSGPCKECGKPTTKDVCWIAKTNPASVAYRFDKDMHFQYWGDWGKRQEGDITETMSLQGSCFMCTKERYFALNLCDEDLGSWGQQGVEVACKTWLSGGRVMVNRKTWYAHMFRTQGGDFGFPYENKANMGKLRATTKDLFAGDKWPKATRKFQWLIDKFNPPEWGLTKGIIYYTDGDLDEKIAKPCRERLIKIAKDKNIPIVTASLKRKQDFGVHNIYFPSLKRSALTLFKQIYAALSHSTADIIFFTEHDDLYDASHFDFTPTEDKNNLVYYYNTNIWQLRLSDGHCVYYHCRKLSQMCCYREVALEHFRKKIAKAELDPTPGHFDRHIGFEPGTRNIKGGGVDDSWKVDWSSPVPNVDVRHAKNYTGSKWSVEEFRNRKYKNKAIETWQEGDSIPHWGLGTDIVKSLT